MEKRHTYETKETYTWDQRDINMRQKIQQNTNGVYMRPKGCIPDVDEEKTVFLYLHIVCILCRPLRQKRRISETKETYTWDKRDINMTWTRRRECVSWMGLFCLEWASFVLNGMWASAGYTGLFCKTYTALLKHRVCLVRRPLLSWMECGPLRDIQVSFARHIRLFWNIECVSCVGLFCLMYRRYNTTKTASIGDQRNIYLTWTRRRQCFYIYV